MKTLFNFYLDEDDKKKAMTKLSDNCGDLGKGLLSSYLRIVVKNFVESPDMSQEDVAKVLKEFVDNNGKKV